MPLPARYRPLNELISLKGQRAIVTGAARGIGFAIACRLAEAGAQVVLSDLLTGKGEKAAADLVSWGYPAWFVPCDVSSEEQVKALVSKAVEKMGGVDLLANNAGIFPRGDLTASTAEQFQRVQAVNVTGAYLCARECAKRMVEQGKGGNIINIASIDGLRPSVGTIAYDASKAAVVNLTQGLALELGKHRVRVNAIAPGFVLTEGVMQISKELPPAADGQNIMEIFRARMPLKKRGVADDIARIALFLASDLSAYMTGAVLVADGGYLIG
jgi:NAD(P)-dependent dehydrogenase (short-subunit alcohol dehydrogenase family)